VSKGEDNLVEMTCQKKDQRRGIWNVLNGTNQYSTGTVLSGSLPKGTIKKASQEFNIHRNTVQLRIFGVLLWLFMEKHVCYALKIE